ncbi:6-phosphogluconolactonase, DevB-type [Artemisia annua]|uniref:6-phosphogluconolactonase, DevB-type n=1 Tax=Artemisia annua TaxID=35608 RepID=A0A2U1QJJ8_ARTAN|nr:6-phosphogluconolactonase, DevB-type [Artemisia annua]
MATCIKKFETEEATADALAIYVSDLSAKSIADHGSFSVVLSGVEPPYIGSVDWSKWLIFWLDERVVPLDHPDSNYKLAYDGFLSKVPIPESNIYPIKENLSPEEAADEYEQRLKNLVANKTLKTSPVTGFAKFDLMLVGMGPDGHVASLFCWHFQRFEKKRWVTFITDSPKPPPPRITFTFPLINSASEIALVIVGEEKADAVKIALGEHADYGYPLPVQKVKPEGGLTWFLDNGATSLLKVLIAKDVKTREPFSVKFLLPYVALIKQVAVALAVCILHLSAQFIADKGSFSVVLSGGPLIDTLRKLTVPPYNSSIDWSKWSIFYMDERVVPLNNSYSNYKLTYDGFLSKTLKTSNTTGFAKFDLMLVAMGPEGHVASLFCWYFQPFEKQKWVTFITDSPKPSPQRITFTFPLINSASEIAIVVVTGEDLADAVKVALGKHANDYCPLPVQKVAPESNLTWFLDQRSYFTT